MSRYHVSRDGSIFPVLHDGKAAAKKSSAQNLKQQKENASSANHASSAAPSDGADNNVTLSMDLDTTMTAESGAAAELDRYQIYLKAQKQLFQTPMPPTIAAPPAPAAYPLAQPAKPKSLDDTLIAAAKVKDSRSQPAAHLLDTSNGDEQEDQGQDEDDEQEDEQDEEQDESNDLDTTITHGKGRLAPPASLPASSGDLMQFEDSANIVMMNDVSMEDETFASGGDATDGGGREDDAGEHSSAMSASSAAVGTASSAASATCASASSHDLPALREPIHVYLRVRPLTAAETQSGGSCVELEDTASVVMHPPPTAVNTAFAKEQRFRFSNVFGPSTTQEDLFNATTLPLLQDVIQGHSCLMFAYGVTNAGKTYTIQGSPASPGVLPRSLQLIFDSIEGRQMRASRLKPRYYNDIQVLTPEEEAKENAARQTVLTGELIRGASASGAGDGEDGSDGDNDDDDDDGDDDDSEHDVVLERELQSTYGLGTKKPSASASHESLDTDVNSVYSVWISFVEVYNEQIYDLLERPPRRGQRRNPLKLAEDSGRNVYLKGVKEIRVFSSKEAKQVMKTGQKARRVAATVLNHESSRSHCVFMIKLVRSSHETQAANASVSSMSFVDLAGSERYTKTQNIGHRLKEAANINTSLMTLGKCMAILRQNQHILHQQPQQPPLIVPFRESKITRLFQNYLSENSVSGRAVMIVNINPSVADYDETCHALKFSAITKQVSTMKAVLPKINTGLGAGGSGASKRGHAATGKTSETVALEGSGSLFLTQANESIEHLERERALLDRIQELQQKLHDCEERALSMEAEIREEVAKEMADQLTELEESYKNFLSEENDLNDDRCEQKMNIYSRIMEERRSLLMKQQQRLSMSQTSRLSMMSFLGGGSEHDASGHPTSASVSRRSSTSSRLSVVPANVNMLGAAPQTVLPLSPTSGTVLLDIVDEEGRRMSLATVQATLTSQHETIASLRDSVKGYEDTCSRLSGKLRELQSSFQEQLDTASELSAVNASLEAQLASRSLELECVSEELARERSVSTELEAKLGAALKQVESEKYRAQQAEEWAKKKVEEVSEEVSVALREHEEMATDLDRERKRYEELALTLAAGLDSQKTHQKHQSQQEEELESQVLRIKSQLSAFIARHSALLSTIASPVDSANAGDFDEAKAAMDELESIVNATLIEMDVAESKPGDDVSARLSVKRSATEVEVQETSDEQSTSEAAPGLGKAGRAKAGKADKTEGRKKKKVSSESAASDSEQPARSSLLTVDEHADVNAGTDATPSSKRNNSYHQAMEKEASKADSAATVRVRSPLMDRSNQSSSANKLDEKTKKTAVSKLQSSISSSSSSSSSKPKETPPSLHSPTQSRVTALLRNSPLMKRMFSPKAYQAAAQVARQALPESSTANPVSAESSPAAMTMTAAAAPAAKSRKLFKKAATVPAAFMATTTGAVEDDSPSTTLKRQGFKPIEKLLSPVAARTRTRSLRK